MIATDCPDCGEPVSTFAKSCAQCGAPNAARRAGLAIAGSLAVLLLAIAIATVAVLRWERLPVVDDTASTPATTEDFGWLATAMKDCDTEAASTLSTLHFLVIPLRSAAGEDAAWRRRSLNDIGNAILLNSDTMLDSLKGGTLRLSEQQYTFGVRDDKSGIVYKWSPSTGVKRFSSPDADKIDNFKVQFVTRDKTDESNWGATFVRRKGNCYWVNAIIGN
jgi:hypothetical protein